MKTQRIRFGIILTIVASITAGCGSLATRREFYKPIAEEVRKGNFASAVTRLEEAKANGKFDEKDRFLYFMDAGLLNHYADSLDRSTAKLALAEKTSEELYAKSVSRAALSLVLNDNVLEYSGEDYEVLYSNLFKALNYIAADSFEAAFVEIRRANQKLELLEQKYADEANDLQQANDRDSSHVAIKYQAKSVRFNSDAFARYLSMHVYAADGKYDDAQIDSDALAAAYVTQPNIYDFRPPDFEYRAQDDDKVVLSVVGMAGLAPVKEAVNFRIRTDKQLDLLTVLYTEPTGKETVFENLPMKIGEDFYFKFSIPTIVCHPSSVVRIKLLVDGRDAGDLEMMESIGTIAKETFEAKKSLIYLKSIARAVVKGLAAHKAKSKADTGGLGGWLKKAAIDVATDLSENADLRCVQYLPGMIYTRDLELAPGSYNLTIQFFDKAGILLYEKNIPGYKVLTNGLNLVQAEYLN